MPLTHAELVQKNRDFTLTSWTSQTAWDPLSAVKGEGVYFWDADGTRFLDWSSQLVNVNVGHSHPRVIQAIREQADRLAYAYPGIATEPRARLAELLSEITPGNLSKTFFTVGGADAIETALKMARLYTGRQKVLGRYRAWHGGTFGATSIGGDPRRIPNEPGVPWAVHFHDPYPYRSPLYRDRNVDEGDRLVADMLEETVRLEGPETIAAIVLEGYSGTNGIVQGGPAFWERVQEICHRFDILLIVDEVLSGFGRTGEWFGVNHYPSVRPDIVAMAKGLTSGYVPLGAASVTEEIAAHFDEETLWSGMTYSSHPLACAAGIANIEVYREEDLIARSREMGKLLRAGLVDLAESHPSVGDVRGTGLHHVLDLVGDRETREPLSPFNRPLNEAMQAVVSSLRKSGVSTLVRWNLVFNSPPLVISHDELQEGLDALDRALAEADRFYQA